MRVPDRIVATLSAVAQRVTANYHKKKTSPKRKRRGIHQTSGNLKAAGMPWADRPDTAQYAIFLSYTPIRRPSATPARKNRSDQ